MENKDEDFSTKFDFKGFTFEVKFTSEGLTAEELGVCEYMTSRLLIRKTLPLDIMKKVLKHEITHAILWLSGFNYVDLKDEIVCDFVSIYGEDIINISNEVFKKYMESK